MGKKRYTKLFLKRELIRFIREHGRIPRIIDMNNKNGYPNGCTYIRVFGSWNNALIETGLKITEVGEYTKEYLILKLKEFYIKKGRSPTVDDVGFDTGYPCYTVYINVFGSWNNALIAAGLPLNHTYDHSNDKCTLCGKSRNLHWFYDEKHNLICESCHTRQWNRNHPERAKLKWYKTRFRRKGFGSFLMNPTFIGAEGHHLHLENRSDFVIFIPEFMHKLHHHDSRKLKTMITVNAIALDYWINEDFYRELYEWEE